MPILRAGPWGNLNNPHEDEPAVKDNQTNIYPVNCARSDWPNQPWRLLYNKSTEISRDTGTAALGSPIVGEGINYAYVALDFNWQATEAFDVTLQWDMTSTQSGSAIYPLLEWEYYTIEGTGEYVFDTPSDSGSINITLPASTFGNFSAYTEGIDTYGYGIQVEASII